MSVTTQRWLLSVPVAVLLSLVLASQALGATWTPTDIRTGDCESGVIGTPGGLVSLGSSTAALLYADGDGYQVMTDVAVRRTSDGGVTWDQPAVLSTEAIGSMAIAGRGSNVDVVWVDKWADAWSGRGASEVVYRRSSDGGVSFAGPVTIESPAEGFPRDVTVGRGPGGLVAIAWTIRQDSWSYIKVRVSTNGGATFGPATTLATGQLREARLAIGDGVIYVVYIKRAPDGSRSLHLRHSLDAGGNWSTARKLASGIHVGYYIDVDTAPAITAEGNHAYVAYVSTASELRYRRTTNRGAGWSASTSIASRIRMLLPAISLHGGTVRVAYAQYTADWWATRYRRSLDGVTWGAPETVTQWDTWVAGVGFATRPLVLYMAPPEGSCGPFGVYVARRTTG